MRTDISNPKIGVGQSTSVNAPKLMFFPQTVNATFDTTRHCRKLIQSNTLTSPMRTDTIATAEEVRKTCATRSMNATLFTFEKC